HALNIPRLIDELCYNLVTPCHGIFHPDSWMYNPDIQLLDFSLAKAASLLDEAGWVIDPSREGWRHKVIDGHPVKFEFTLTYASASEVMREVSAIYQEDLKRVGVSMKPQPMEWATLSQRVRKHEFQASSAAWGTGIDPDTSWNLWHSDQYDPEGKFGRNYPGFKNDRVDELFRLGREENDQKKRQKYYQEITKIIYDEQPYTFMWNRGTLWGINNRIRGIEASPGRGLFGFDPAVKVWWVPARKD
ncbi:MAG: ABC transporter substrate-binding protein, partial [Planctomycetota bacterium]